MFVLALLLWQTASFDVGKIDVNGLQRLKTADVLASIGVREGARAGKAEFDAACRRLVETGLFAGCNWKYVPVSQTSVAMTFDLTEAPAEQTVRLRVPGASDTEVWSWLRTNEPLAQPKMPVSDDAVQFYAAAVQRYLKRKVVPSIDTNLETKETTLVFRPADAPASFPSNSMAHRQSPRRLWKRNWSLWQRVGLLRSTISNNCWTRTSGLCTRNSAVWRSTFLPSRQALPR